MIELQMKETEIVVGGFGFGLLLLGGILWFFRRAGWVRWAIESRKALIEECRRAGEEQRAQRLGAEIQVFEVRLPAYSRILLVAGLALLAVSFVVYFVG